MATIVTRLGKGSALTHAEGDANFTNLNNDLVDTISKRKVQGITALKAITPTSGERVYLAYHTTEGDGGHGVFRGITGAAPGTYTDDNGITIVPTGGDGSTAWQREYTGPAVVKWFGITGTGDETSKLQGVINTGLDLDLVGLTLYANNLTQSTNNQSIISSKGEARIIKNASGPLFTASGDYLILNTIAFRGDAASPTFTGDNLVITGDHPLLINCGSRWATGRALKATGNHVQVWGTCDIWQTVDATATGYDIEIGAAGVSTLYHELHGIYSSQSAGGILSIDTGNTHIIGGQFGKLTLQASISVPAGANGGHTIGARILGPISVGLSSAKFAGNMLGGSATLTFELGTSECRFDLSNSVSAAVTNNGNANNLIMREVSTGGVNSIRFGDDSGAAKHISVDRTGPIEFFHNVRFPAGFNLQWTNGVGGYNTVVNASTTNSTFGNSGLGLNFTGNNRQTYTVTNAVSDRAYDANATTVDELADVLGTLIADLRTLGLVL